MNSRVFPADLNHLYDMLLFIKNFGCTKNLSPDFLDRIVLATEEALVNIISYGYPGDEKGVIEITCEEASPKGGIKIMIKDEGVPFNPLENVSASTNLLQKETADFKQPIGGYGICILISLMDRVEYERKEGGNLLSLIKYL